MKGELGALSMLKYGRGLPVQTDEDLVYVDKLRENYEKERNLPPKGKQYFIRRFRHTSLMFLLNANLSYYRKSSKFLPVKRQNDSTFRCLR